MKLLLDSHILVAIALKRLPEVSGAADRLLRRPGVEAWISVASLWEIAIKTRLGKLDPGLPLEDLPAYFEAAGFKALAITTSHALAAVTPLPPTRDPSTVCCWLSVPSRACGWSPSTGPCATIRSRRP